VERASRHPTRGRYPELQERLAELEQTVQSLRESEQRFRTLVEQSSEVILLIGDRIVQCNSAALDILRCTRDDLVGQRLSAFSPPVQRGGRSTRELERAFIDLARAEVPVRPSHGGACGPTGRSPSSRSR